MFTIEASNATSHAFDIDFIDYLKACSKNFNCSINKNIPQFNTRKAKWPLIRLSYYRMQGPKELAHLPYVYNVV